MTTFKIRRLSLRSRANIIRGLHRSWEPGGAHDLRFRHKEIDADTQRLRTLWDRKGSHYASIKMNGREFQCYWSTLGRSDQVDIFCENRKMTTCSINRIWREISQITTVGEKILD